MLEPVLLASGAVVLTAVSQLLLKIAARKTVGLSLVRRYLNVHVIVSYGIFLLVTLMNLSAYRILPIKLAVVFLPFTFIFVGFFSFLFLKERMTGRQLAGAAVILAGVVVYNL